MTQIQDRWHGSWIRARAALTSAAVAVSAVVVMSAAAPDVAQAASGDTIIYGVNGFGTRNVTALDITAQTATGAGNLARESGAVDIDPATGRLYFYEWRSNGDEFGYFDPASGASTIVRTYAPRPGHLMTRMAFAPAGALYAMDDDDTLYSIDPITGDQSELGAVDGLDGDLTTGTGDMSFADDGTLYVAVDRNLYIVDVGSRSATLQYSGMIPVSGVGFTVWTGLAHCDGVMYASNVEQFSSRAGIFTIDPATGDEELLFYAPSRLNDLASCSQVEPPANTAPVAVDGDVVTAQDTTASVLLSASDVDGDVLTYEVTAGPGSGVLSGAAPNLTYAPNRGFAGTDTFSFVANDGQVDSNAATVTITVDAVANVAPVAVDGDVVTAQDVAVALTLSASDVDGDVLTYEVTAGPGSGVLSGAAPNLTYAPNPGFAGTDTFTFVANDGQVDSNSATVTITVDAVANVAPVAVDGDVVTAQDVAVALTLSASDVDGDALTYEVTTGPGSGVLSGAAPNLTYAPNPGFAGTDTFTFVANDGQVDSNAATVTITVDAAANAPGPPTDVVAATGDASVTLSWLAPIDDGGSPITDYVVESSRRGESWSTFADGVSVSTTVTVTGLTNYDEYRFRVATATASATGEPAETSWSTPTDGNDPDDTFNHPDGNLGDRPGWSIVDPDVLSDLRLADGYVIGTSDPDGTASVLTAPVGPDVEVTIDALLGDSYNEASAVLRMPTRDDYDESYLLQWVTDGDFVSVGTVTGPAIQIWRLDPNRITLLADAQLADNGERTLTFGAQGSTIYIAENDTVLLSVTDDTYLTGDFFALGQADFSDGGTPTRLDNLRYEILDPPPNTAPVAVDGTVATDTGVPVAVTLSASDVDGDVLTFEVTAGPGSGVLSGTAPNLTYAPNAGFVGTDTFTFVANDGQDDSNPATVTVTVAEEANTAPVAVDGTFATDTGAPVAVTLSASDVDGDVLTFEVTAGPGSGVLSGTAPNLTYAPNAGFVGTDTFTFVANDGQVDSNSATVTVTVAEEANTAPVAVDGTFATDTGVPVAVTLSASDVDGDVLTFEVTAGPSGGVLSGTAPNLTYAPNAGFAGTDTFSFVANDGQVDSNPATVTVTVAEPTPVLTTWGADRTGKIRSIDLIDGTSTSAPRLSFGTQAMDRDPVTGEVYYFEWGTNGNEFAVWNPVTGTNTAIRTYNPAPGLNVVQMAFAPDGTLYIIDSAGILHTIDTVSGDITTLGSISGLVNGVYGQAGDLAFAPDGTGYLATYGELYELDVTTRVATVLHSDMFGDAPFLWLGLAHCDGRLFGSHVDGANRSAIYEIDVATGGITRLHYMASYVADLTGCATS